MGICTHIYGCDPSIYMALDMVWLILPHILIEDFLEQESMLFCDGDRQKEKEQDRSLTYKKFPGLMVR